MSIRLMWVLSLKTLQNPLSLPSLSHFSLPPLKSPKFPFKNHPFHDLLYFSKSFQYSPQKKHRDKLHQIKSYSIHNKISHHVQTGVEILWMNENRDAKFTGEKIPFQKRAQIKYRISHSWNYASIIHTRRTLSFHVRKKLFFYKKEENVIINSFWNFVKKRS